MQKLSEARCSFCFLVHSVSWSRCFRSVRVFAEISSAAASLFLHSALALALMYWLRRSCLDVPTPTALPGRSKSRQTIVYLCDFPTLPPTRTPTVISWSRHHSLASWISPVNHGNQQRFALFNHRLWFLAITTTARSKTTAGLLDDIGFPEDKANDSCACIVIGDSHN